MISEPADHTCEYQSYPGLLRYQLVLLDLLSFLDWVCKKHAINYWMDGGTLLGAIRHQGFIPWDDDADVCVLAASFERLRKVLIDETRWHPRFFISHNARSPRNVLDHMHMSLNSLDGFRRLGHSFQHFGLDISNAKILPNSPGFIDEDRNRTKSALNGISAGLREETSIFLELLTTENYLTKFDYLTSEPNNCRVTYAFHEWAADTKSAGTPLQRPAYKYIDVFPITRYKFAGLTLSGPANAENYLSALYSNYRELPPKNERKPFFEGAAWGLCGLLQEIFFHPSQSMLILLWRTLRVRLEKRLHLASRVSSSAP